jgi:hypothetical protein
MLLYMEQISGGVISFHGVGMWHVACGMGVADCQGRWSMSIICPKWIDDFPVWRYHMVDVGARGPCWWDTTTAVLLVLLLLLVLLVLLYCCCYDRT